MDGFDAMTGTPATGGTSDAVAQAVARMSLDEKVGQLFVVPLGRHSATALRLPPDQRHRAELADDTIGQVVDQVRRYQVGGVCYFPTRFEGDEPGDVAAMLAEVAAAAEGTQPRPIVALDQEGGTVARLTRGMTAVPSAMALAATGDPASAETAAAIVGAELRAIGFHQNYAPVADVNSNPANPVIGVRSYGSDPADVSRYVVAAVRGLHAAGLAATVKHFPGHGDTAADSHLELPTVGRDQASWADVDLVPFAAAIGAGVDAIMSAHVAVPAVDPTGDPATASAAILTGVLRNRLGFDGVVVTDALDMTGARQRWGDGEIAVRALAAGADQLILPADLPVAVAAVAAAVRSGRVPAARLDDAVTRILTVKHRVGLLPGGQPATAPPVDSAAHAADALDLARRAVTVLGDRDWRLPTHGRVALVGYLDGIQDVLLPALAGVATTVVDTGADPDSVADAVRAAADADETIAVTRGAIRWQGQRELLAALAGRRHVLLALRDPYDAGLAPSAVARVLTYGDNATMRTALTGVVTGTATASGRLPVDIPGPDGRIAFPRGTG